MDELIVGVMLMLENSGREGEDRVVDQINEWFCQSQLKPTGMHSDDEVSSLNQCYFNQNLRQEIRSFVKEVKSYGPSRPLYFS